MAQAQEIKKSSSCVFTFSILMLIVFFTQFVFASEIDDISCVDCHDRTMEVHRFPIDACKTCHSPDMSTLVLKNETIILIEDSNYLCAQCHDDIYQAWDLGAHAIEGSKCVECHDPHSDYSQFVIYSSISSIALSLQILFFVGAIIGLSLVVILFTKKLREK